MFSVYFLLLLVWERTYEGCHPRGIDLTVLRYISFILKTERNKIESMSVVCMPVSALIMQNYPHKIVDNSFYHMTLLYSGAIYQVSLTSVRRFRRRRFLKGFYHMWAWQQSWSCDLDKSYIFSHPPPLHIDVTCQICLWLAVSEKVFENGGLTTDRPFLSYKPPLSLRLR